MLPGTQQGTGLYLDSRGDGTRAFQNVVINHYVENSKIGAYYQDQQHVLVDGMFMQGGTSGDRAEALVVADRAEVTLNAVTGQDFFDAKVKAINGSLVWVNSMKGPINATTEWDADATSKIKMRGIVDKDKFEYFMDKPNGTASMDFVLPTEVPQFSVAKLYLTGIRDGTSSRFGEMTIARYTTAAGIRAAWITGGNDTWPTQIDVSVSNAGVITVTLMDTPRIQMYAILELIGGHMLSGNATTITGT